MRNKIIFRIPGELHQRILHDLRKPHAHAFERIGFVFTHSKSLDDHTVLIWGTDYEPVEDADYIEDSTVGARINADAIRKPRQRILRTGEGCFHVHMHDFNGLPTPSRTDRGGIPPIVESLVGVNPAEFHGMLILSEDSLYAEVMSTLGMELEKADAATVVGIPFISAFPKIRNAYTGDLSRFERQSFLGEHSWVAFQNLRIGIVGYGGGGSQIGLQLAHLGFENITVFDPDRIEPSNLNRLLGGWHADLAENKLKTEIAQRTIKNVNPNASVQLLNNFWQAYPGELHKCDFVIGCVDSFQQRQELESECRRFLIPYIDIGMDVHTNNAGRYGISGQVIASIPGQACMQCLGFITPEKLGKEAQLYGNAGGRPQVVWSNGVLASTAIGVLVETITNWTVGNTETKYICYDGNSGELIRSHRPSLVTLACPHYPVHALGSIKFESI